MPIFLVLSSLLIGASCGGGHPEKPLSGIYSILGKDSATIVRFVGSEYLGGSGERAHTAWFVLKSADPSGWNASDEQALQIDARSGLAGFRKAFIGRTLWCNLWINSPTSISSKHRTSLRPFDSVRVTEVYVARTRAVIMSISRGSRRYKIECDPLDSIAFGSRRPSVSAFESLFLLRRPKEVWSTVEIESTPHEILGVPANVPSSVRRRVPFPFPQYRFRVPARRGWADSIVIQEDPDGRTRSYMRPIANRQDADSILSLLGPPTKTMEGGKYTPFLRLIELRDWELVSTNGEYWRARFLSVASQDTSTSLTLYRVGRINSIPRPQRIN